MHKHIFHSYMTFAYEFKVIYTIYKSTEITEVSLSAFVYRLFPEDFCLIVGTNLRFFFRRLERNLHETVSKQVQIN